MELFLTLTSCSNVSPWLFLHWRNRKCFSAGQLILLSQQPSTRNQSKSKMILALKSLNACCQKGVGGNPLLIYDTF